MTREVPRHLDGVASLSLGTGTAGAGSRLSQHAVIRTARARW